MPHDGISCKDEESYVTTFVTLERCDNTLLVLTGSPSGGLTYNLSGLSEGGQAPEPVLTRQPRNWSRRAQMLCERTRTGLRAVGAQAFNDWFSCLPQRRLPMSSRYKDPYRGMLPDTGEIKFTHGDLH